MVGWCWNSRQWVDFMMPKPPKSCPYLDFQGEQHCVNETCGYYEEREPSKHYNHKLKYLREMYADKEGE